MKNGHDKQVESEFPREEVYSAISKGIQQGQKIQHTKQFDTNIEKVPHIKWKRKLVYFMSAAVIAMCLFTGSAYVSPAFANVVSQWPIVGSIFSEIGRPGLQHASEKGLTSTIGETQTVNGTSMTIDEVLYDQTRLTISYSIESKAKLEEHYLGMGHMKYMINGESPDSSSGSLKETVHSPTSSTGIIEYDMNEAVPDEFQFDLYVEAKDGKQWEFSIPVETIEGLKTFPVHHRQTAGNIDLHVTHMSRSSSGLSLSYEAVSPKGKHYRTEAMYLEFRMTDDKGNEVESHSGGSKGTIKNGEMHFTGKKLFDPVDEEIKKVTITPYIMLPTGGGGVEIDNEGNTTELDSHIDELNEVKFKPFTVTLP